MSAIGSFFQKSHSTVKSNIDKIKELEKEDRKVKREIKELEDKLKFRKISE